MARCKDCFHWDACKKMLESFTGHCIPSGYEGGADRCEDFISAADVAPRAEVAREIFEEIMRAMERGVAEADKAVINNTSILDFRESLCRAGEMYAGYIGVAICKVFQKYTEGKE